MANNHISNNTVNEKQGCIKIGPFRDEPGYNPLQVIIWFGEHEDSRFEDFLKLNTKDRYLRFIRGQCRTNPSPNVRIPLYIVMIMILYQDQY
jgi:hypothetical protein